MRWGAHAGVCAAVALTASVLGMALRRGADTVQGSAPSRPYVHAAIVDAAATFLARLDERQRARAQFAFDDDERLSWHFVPRVRRGLPLGAMSASQQEAARGILRAALSQRGFLQAGAVIELETVLREMGENPAVRDPGLYYFSIFGTPSADAAWGFRVEGHHLSLNFTLVRDSLIAATHAFFGAHPAEVRAGTRQGLRVLGSEEDVARELVLSLNERQLRAALIAAQAPRDIVTGNARHVQPLSPSGIRITELNASQAATLMRLIDVYLGRMAEPIAARRRAVLERTDINDLTFAWAGSTRKGDPHYYRVQGPSFLIEYDNTQNNANHIHTVWRDFDGDFGRDLLREHYRDAPHPH